MPSGTATRAARVNPPSTRQIVMPMSRMKPCLARSSHPSSTIVSGSARNVFDTKPPRVAKSQAAKNSTKNRTPSTTRAVLDMGARGFIGVPTRQRRQSAGIASLLSAVKAYRMTPRMHPPCGERRSPQPSVASAIALPLEADPAAALLHEPRVGELREVRYRLDHADLEQQVGGLLREARVFAGEECLVGGLVLPAQVLRRVAELLAGLAHVGPHDVVGLLLVGLDHLERVEIARRQCLHGAVVLGDEFRRAAERVHDHRVVKRGGDDLAGLGLLAHR